MGKAHAEWDMSQVVEDESECVNGEFGACVNALIPMDTEVGKSQPSVKILPETGFIYPGN